MTRSALLLCLMGGVTTVPLAAQLTDPVATAVLPLADTLRAGATVVNYADNQVLRRGTNGITCLTDRPADNRLSLVCYPSAVEGYMRRGRELSAEGIRGNEYRAILGAEVKTGALYFPSGVLLRNVSGTINDATGVPDSVRVWVEFLLPFADAAALGIPLFDSGLDPWMMSAGTVAAHVMVRYRWMPWDEVE